MSHFNKTALITGGTSGLGYEAALRIAKQHPDWLIVIASRNDNGAAQKMNKKLRQDNVKFMALDLGSIEKVRAFAKSWAEAKCPPIQALLLNAILHSGDKLDYSVDGFERTFAINHVGHALLLALLGPYMDNKARIVITGSGVHDPAQKWFTPEARYETAEKLARPPADTQFSGLPGPSQYTATKFANVLWMYALDRRLRTAGEQHGRHWTVTQSDPGMLPDTGFVRSAGPFVRWIFNHILANMTPVMRALLHPRVFTVDKCGAELAALAVSPEFEGKSGLYYEDLVDIKTSEDSYDEAKQEDLWKWTVDTLARDDEERKLFECDFA
ncbi:dehydrogenase/reductase [Sarocladium strictum]